MFDGGVMRRRRDLRALFALLLLSLSTGCAASSDYMRPTLMPLDAPPPPGSATVVFVRPSSYGTTVLMGLLNPAPRITVLDEQGRFIGDATADSCFVAPVPAGKHLFVGWAENTAALQADLAPGRVYFVEVSPRIGWLTARVQLLAITPQNKRWKDLEEWVSDCDKFRPDEAGGQAYLNGRRDDATERIRRAKAALADYDTEELRERTLLPADGVEPTPYAPPGTLAPRPAADTPSERVAPALPPPPPAPPQ